MTARIRITQPVDSAEIARQITPHMEALGQAVGSRMQRLIPKRTWAAHDTIETVTETRGEKVTTIVGVGNEEIDYPVLLERGTSRMRAQPFMRPAFAQVTGSDLNYNGSGITRHGVVSFGSRRSRARARSAGRS